MRFAFISPKVVFLRGPVGKNIKKEVLIIPDKEFPFKIIDISAKYGANIEYKLERRIGSTKKGYKLFLKNMKKVKGRYSDIIYLKTDSETVPELTIKIYGDIYVKQEKKDGSRK